MARQSLALPIALALTSLFNPELANFRTRVAGNGLSAESRIVPLLVSELFQLVLKGFNCRTRIEGAVICRGTVSDQEFSIQTKCWQLIADAFFGFGAAILIAFRSFCNAPRFSSVTQQDNRRESWACSISQMSSCVLSRLSFVSCD